MSEDENTDLAKAEAEAEAALKAAEEAKRKAELVKLQGEIKTQKTKVTKLEKKNKVLIDSEKLLKEDAEKLKASIADLTAENTDLKVQLEAKPKEVEVVNTDEIDKLKVEVEELNKRIKLDDDQIESYELRYEEVMKELAEKPKEVEVEKIIEKIIEVPVEKVPEPVKIEGDSYFTTAKARAKIIHDVKLPCAKCGRYKVGVCSRWNEPVKETETCWKWGS